MVRLPKELQDLLRLASDIAAKDNLPIYLVGGFVRDLILGVKNLDLDILVEGNGIKFAEDFAKILNAKLIRHRRFGTATLLINHRLKIDIATARKESYPEPACLPLVVPGVLEDDFVRRDFTINAMAVSINKQDFGRLIDLFNGKKDLRDKKIRILHNLSFIDDPTRMLRAVRFEKRYNFKIESKTLKLLKEAARQNMLQKVQPQRLRDELILILKEEYPLRVIKRIKELIGFNFISLHLSVSRKTYDLFRSIEKQINWFKINFPHRRALDTWLVYLLGLLDSLSANEIRSICKKYVFRKGEEKRLLAYKKINGKSKFIRILSQGNIKPSEIFTLLEPLSYEVIIFIKAKYKHKNIQRNIENFLKIYNGMRIHISGDDLQKIGIEPGPNYQKIFKKVLIARLDGLVKTKEDELAMIRRML